MYLLLETEPKNELVYYVAFKLLVTGLKVVSPLDKFFPRWFSNKVQVKSLLLDEPIFRKNHVIFPKTSKASNMTQQICLKKIPDDFEVIN